MQSQLFNLFQGVPQSSVLGSLLSKDYVNNMKNFFQSPLYLVEYVEVIFIFVASKDIVTSVEYKQKGNKGL